MDKSFQAGRPCTGLAGGQNRDADHGRIFSEQDASQVRAWKRVRAKEASDPFFVCGSGARGYWAARAASMAETMEASSG